MLKDFVQNVENVCRDVMNEIHTAMPGKINDVDENTGMAGVTPIGRYVTPTGKQLPYPKITGVPILMPQCASLGAEVAFPVREGDNCLIVISEEELDAWLYGEESDSELRFDLTNAICIPGLSSRVGSAFKEACNTKSVVIANGDTKITVSKNGINMYGNVKVYGTLTSTET